MNHDTIMQLVDHGLGAVALFFIVQMRGTVDGIKESIADLRGEVKSLDARVDRLERQHGLVGGHVDA